MGFLVIVVFIFGNWYLGRILFLVIVFGFFRMIVSVYLVIGFLRDLDLDIEIY